MFRPLSMTIPRTAYPWMGMWVGGLALVFGLWNLFMRGQENLIVAIMVGIVVIIVALRDKNTAILLMMGYLNVLGDVRRLADYVTGIPSLDFLLLIGPVLAAFLALPLLIKIRVSDGLSKGMLYLTVIMVLEIFNPKQGGIVVGFSGALFYLVPVLWFWVGRRYATPALVERLLYKVVFPIGLASALLGLCQNFVGFTPWEQAWIDIVAKTYVVLNLGNGHTRAFGFSVSSAEYATLLGIACVAIPAAWYGRRKIWVLVAPVLFIAMFLASSRGIVFRTIITLGFVYAFRKGKPLSTVVVVRLVAFTAIGLGITMALAARYQIADTGSGQSSADKAISHQTGGLAHPFDSKYSTAGAHSDSIMEGLLQGFTYPIGHGLGSTTGAGSKFGVSGEGGSSEVDFVDIFKTLGVLGGFVYLYLVFATYRAAFAYTRLVPLGVGLPTMSIIITTTGSWLIGGQYGTAALVFFLIGGTINREVPKEKKPTLTQAPTRKILNRRSPAPTAA